MRVLLYTTLLFSYCNLHCASLYKTFHYCERVQLALNSQHTFIAKLLPRVFRKVNDDITSYKINYNTI